MTFLPPLYTQPINDIIDLFLAADEERITELLDDLLDWANVAIEDENIIQIVNQRAQLDRICRRLEETDSERFSEVVASLTHMDTQLEHSRSHAAARQDFARREEEYYAVRAEILALLEQSRSVREIVDSLRCDPSHVARARKEQPAV